MVAQSLTKIHGHILFSPCLKCWNYFATSRTHRSSGTHELSLPPSLCGPINFLFYFIKKKVSVDIPFLPCLQCVNYFNTSNLIDPQGPTRVPPWWPNHKKIEKKNPQTYPFFSSPPVQKLIQGSTRAQKKNNIQSQPSSHWL